MSCRRLSIASLTLTLLTAGCSVPPAVPQSGDAFVYVIDRGWHTDIGLPVQEITGPLSILEAAFPGVRFLTFGFGERQFLVNHGKTFGAMLSALLPSRSALLMTALRAPPAVAFGQSNAVVLHVSEAGLQQILSGIWNELARTSAGRPMLLANGPYPGSVFYAARDTYSGLYTCNTWTAGILRAGGLPFPVTGMLFAGQVMGVAHWIGAHHTS